MLHIVLTKPPYGGYACTCFPFYHPIDSSNYIKSLYFSFINSCHYPSLNNKNNNLAILGSFNVNCIATLDGKISQWSQHADQEFNSNTFDDTYLEHKRHFRMCTKTVINAALKQFIARLMQLIKINCSTDLVIRKNYHHIKLTKIPASMQILH